MSQRQFSDAGSASLQCAPAVLMIRPANFGFNPETASSNRFQRHLPAEAAGGSAGQALAEFAELQSALKVAGVRACVVPDTPEPVKPDAIFPNNWVSFHADGTVVLYPMEAPNRRLERRFEILAAVERELGFRRRRLFDLSTEEVHGRFLEGTGSLVLDHVERVAYACRSTRTHEELVREWAHEMKYDPEVFDAAGLDGAPLYHTNVMLAIGPRFAVVCLEAVATNDRARLRARLSSSGRELIEINLAAMHAFAANVLVLRAVASAGDSHSVLVMSARGRAALDGEQRARLASVVDRIIVVAAPTIETVGGGGVRCMLAEVPDLHVAAENPA